MILTKFRSNSNHITLPDEPVCSFELESIQIVCECGNESYGVTQFVNHSEIHEGTHLSSEAQKK